MSEIKDRELKQVDGGYSPPEYDDYIDGQIRDVDLVTDTTAND